MRIRAPGWFRAALALGAGAVAVTTPVPAAVTPAPSDPAALCEDAARRAAPEAGVPAEVLLAVMLSESGRAAVGAGAGRLRPWPWTVNAAGRGHYFPDRAAAEAFAAARLAEGAVVFDAGCAQINYRWHGHAFPSAAAMFDPMANARYAAGFLSRLHAELGTWPAAAGAYHSRTPMLAAAYRERFATHLAALGQGETMATGGGGGAPAGAPPPPPPAPQVRANLFPLLRAGAPGAPGSLVPAALAGPGRRAPGAAPSLFAAAGPLLRAAGALVPGALVPGALVP